MSNRLHYALVAGEVMFQDLENNNSLHTIRLNTVITNDEPFVGLRHIASAQQAIQMQAFKKLGTEIKVIDVFVIAISHLGHMTKEEFEFVPEGFQVQERIEQPEVN